MSRDANEGARRCGQCGQTMRCDAVRDHYRGILHAGTTYHHTCGSCGLRVRTISTWKAILDLGGTTAMVLVCLGGAGALVVQGVSRLLDGAAVPGMWWGLSAAMLAIGLGFVAVAAHCGLGVVNRRRHPLLR